MKTLAVLLFITPPQPREKITLLKKNLIGKITRVERGNIMPGFLAPLKKTRQIGDERLGKNQKR